MDEIVRIRKYRAAKLIESLRKMVESGRTPPAKIEALLNDVGVDVDDPRKVVVT